MVSIQFLGAAGTVTGSKHLLKTPEKNILVDCGLFQGIKSLRQKNREPLPVSVEEIGLIILTHAHLDHCGYIPLLVKSGFRGRIIMTPPTRDLTEIILLDTGKIQEEDAERENKLGISKHNPSLPLYTVKDVEYCVKFFETAEDNQWQEISPNIKFRFRKNGHILGSVFVEFECYGKKIVFSGDLGRKNSETLNPPMTVDSCDYLIMESTYGDRNHTSVLPKDEMSDVINDCIREHGNLLIPSFAIGRAQELMEIINELKKEIRIPEVPVYLDSPMAASATHVLRKFPKWHKLSPEECNSVFNDIRIITDFKDTRRTIDDKKIKIVIAASGMLTGGRVLEYAMNYIGNKSNTILLVGYQAEGTRGRALKEGCSEIKIFSKYLKVLANIREISSLSAHADQGEMLEWIHAIIKKPEKIFLVHGEANAREAFRVKIKDEFGIDVIIPMQNDEVVLF